MRGSKQHEDGMKEMERKPRQAAISLLLLSVKMKI